MRLRDKFQPFDIVTRNDVVYLVTGEDKRIVLYSNCYRFVIPYCEQDVGYCEDDWKKIGNAGNALCNIGQILLARHNEDVDDPF